MDTTATVEELIKETMGVIGALIDANDRWRSAVAGLKLEDALRQALEAIKVQDSRLADLATRDLPADDDAVALLAQAVENYIRSTDSLLAELWRQPQILAKAPAETVATIVAYHNLTAQMITLKLAAPADEGEEEGEEEDEDGEPERCADQLVARLGAWLDQRSPGDPEANEAILAATIALSEGRRPRLKLVDADDVMEAWEEIAERIAQEAGADRRFGQAPLLGQIFCFHDELDKLFIGLSRVVQ